MKVDCGIGATACICDCGHLSSWHVAFQRWLALCLVAGCICEHMDVCDCVGLERGDDAKVLAELGIAAQ